LDDPTHSKGLTVGLLIGSLYLNGYREKGVVLAKTDTYKEVDVAGASTPFGRGHTTTAYDLNGNLSAVSETFATKKNRIKGARLDFF
jgi:hypothetical protein